MKTDETSGDRPQLTDPESMQQEGEAGQHPAIADCRPDPCEGYSDLSEEAEQEPLVQPDRSKLKPVVEVLLFVSEQPLSLERLASLLGGSRRELRLLVDELNGEYKAAGRAFEIVEVAQGLQVRTRPEFSLWIGKLRQQRPQRLSRPALESLAMIAYRQPTTRAEIEVLRGVDTGAVLGSLLERKLIRILGRKEVPGRPILYGTTGEFLELFGLKNLSSLPTLREIEGMFKEKPESEGELLVEGGTDEDTLRAKDSDSLPALQDSVADTEARESAGTGAVSIGADVKEVMSKQEDELDELDAGEMDAILRAARTRILAFEGDSARDEGAKHGGAGEKEQVGEAPQRREPQGAGDRQDDSGKDE